MTLGDIDGQFKVIESAATECHIHIPYILSPEFLWNAHRKSYGLSVDLMTFDLIHFLSELKNFAEIFVCVCQSYYFLILIFLSF